MEAAAESSGSVKTASESSNSAPGSPREGEINGSFNDESDSKDTDQCKLNQRLLFGKRKRNKEEMLCQVCNDKAQGVNFDAITCESCKAFFRRNALKDKKGKCLFEGNCSINPTTRKFCSFCRLNKCFSIGMNKELILGADERKKRMEKVMNNREKKIRLEQQLSALAETQASLQQAVHISAQVGTTPITLSVQSTPVQSPAVSPSPDVLAAVQDVLGVIPKTLRDLPSSLVIPSVPVPDTFVPEASRCFLAVKNEDTAKSENNSLVSNFVTVKSENSVSTSVLGTEPATTASVDTVPPIPIDLADKRTLSEWEDSTLKDIKEMFNISFCIDVEPHIHVKVKDPKLNHLINQSGITVLRIIKFAKQLKEFVHLPQEHQIGILKGAVLDILLLRSVALYDLERDAWVTPKGEISTQILKSATGFVELYNAYVEYCKSLRLIIGSDNVIIAIMLVIGLFSPEGQHVLARQLISGFQDQYLTLLKHYLEANYSYSKTAEMFPKLLCKIKEIKDFAYKYGKVVMDVNPNEIEPLMLEILDLK